MRIIAKPRNRGQIANLGVVNRRLKHKSKEITKATPEEIERLAAAYLYIPKNQWPPYVLKALYGNRK
jgi:hypothetical protein